MALNSNDLLIEDVTAYLNDCVSMGQGPDAEYVAEILLKYRSPILAVGLAHSFQRCFEQVSKHGYEDFWGVVATFCARQVEL